MRIVHKLSSKEALSIGIAIVTLATLPFTIHAQTNCVAPPSGLVGWWRAESNATDAVSGNDGTISGGVTFAAGEVAQAFSFNGVGEVSVLSAPALNVQNFTFEGWVNPSVLDGNVDLILNKENSPALSAADVGYEVGIRGTGDPGNGSIPLGHLAFFLGGINGLPSNYGSWVDGGGTVPTSTWSHWAIAFDGTSVRVYINGSLTRTINGLSGTVRATSGSFKIGSRSANQVSGDPSVRFNGLIDELSVYYRPLSASEIQSIYNAGSAGKCPLATNCISEPSGVVSWWKGESNGVDQIGTNNGTLVGNATYGPGKVGQAFVFDGAGSYFSASSSDLLKFTNNFSLASWIFPTGAGQHPVEGGTIVNREGEYTLARFADGSIQWAFANQSPGWLWTSSGGSAPLNQWTHVAFTYSSGVVSIFINGQLVQSFSGSGLIGDAYPSLNDFRIGARPASNQGFAGIIDEISVFNGVITPNEVAAIYAAGNQGMCPPQTAPVIVTQPSNQTVVVGGTATFGVTAGGTTPLNFQWFFNETNIINGATGSSLTLSNAQAGDAGSYSVLVSNSVNSVLSSNAVLTVNPPPPCVAPPSGLVSWWRAQNNAADSISNNNGTISGGVSFVAGKVNQAFSFDGAGEVSVASSPSLNIQAFTFEAWVNPSVIDANVETILNKENNPPSGPSDVSYEIGIRGTAGPGGSIPAGNLTFFLGGIAGLPDNYSSWVDGGGAVPINQWSHCALAFDGTSVRVYINGVLTRSITGLSGAISSTTGPLKIGSRSTVVVSSAPALRFNGLIDEVSIYNRALSAAEIQSVYNANGSGKCEEPTAPIILSQPENQTVMTGGTATFSVTATGTLPLNFQWFFNETNIINGATGSSLILSNAQTGDAGSYSVMVSNSVNSVLSSNAVLTVNPPPPCVAPPSGLVSWWRAQNNAADSISGNNGTLSGGVSFVAGKVNQAFSFDGAGEVSVASSPSLNIQAFTFEAWVNPSVIDANVETILNKENNPPSGPSDVSYEIGIRGTAGPGGSIPAGNLTFFLGGIAGLPDNYSSWVDGGGAVPINQWSHCALAFDGTSVRVYINGVLTRSITGLSGAISSTTGPLKIGSRSSVVVSSTPSLRFNGLIDEVSIYNRALSAAEIQAVYNAGSSGKCETPIAPFILSQPGNQTVMVGETAAFSVGAGGTPPLSYQWLLNGTNIDGATGSSFSMTNVQLSNAGLYSVLVTNAVDSVLSSNASLTVNPLPSALRVGDVSTPSGATVIVPVLLTANGFENSLSFTLNFSPSRLTYVGATVGSVSNATLLINDSGSSTGRVGLLFGLGGENTFSPGTQELAQVTFTSAIVTNPVSTPISFVGVPIPQQVSGVHGNVLQATYTNGTVSIAAADFEADVTPPPAGDKDVTVADWSLIGRFAAHLESPTNAAQFQRADCAPRGTLGNGSISITDWVQAGRYAARLDPLTIVGGPDSPESFAFAAAKSNSRKSVNNRQLIAMDANVNQAHTATVSISLQSQGDENALGFSISFDPTKLSYKGTALGNAANGSILNVNTAEVTAGRLGIALAVPSGTHLLEGLDELVKVSFQPALSCTGAVSVVFTNRPIDREISDAAANVLTAEYLNGTLTINPLPSLKISQAGPNINLSWESWATNFALQEIGAFSGTWSNVSATVTTTNNENSVALPMNATTRFYRLFQQ